MLTYLMVTAPPVEFPALPLAQLWYTVAPRADDIVQIREAWIDPYLTGDMWLVRGRDRNLLVDTGTGMVPPSAVVEALARGPVLAVATNGWYDHAGGLHDFGARACHVAEAAIIATPTADSSVASLYVSDAMLRAVPRPRFSTASYCMKATQVTQTLEDNQVLDLGNRSLRVLNVPGDTPGHMVLFEEASGTLFTGDTLFDDPAPESRAHYHVGLTPASPESRRQRASNLQRLARLPVRTVCAGHFGQFERLRFLELVEQAAGI